MAISGRGSNLQALLRATEADGPAEIVLVITDKPEASGLDHARRRGIPVTVLADAGAPEEWLQSLHEKKIDLLVLAGYLKLVPAAVVAAYRGRIMNTHPSLLPAFGGKGMYGDRVHRAVLASGARETGVTIHLVDEAYDRGPILAQSRVPIREGDTAEDLAARVLEAEHRLLPAAVLAAAAAGRPVVLGESEVRSQESGVPSAGPGSPLKGPAC